LQVVNTKLHPLNKKALLYLVEFLRTFLAPEVEGRTKMNLANIATIFGPNLLRAPDAEVRALPHHELGSVAHRCCFCSLVRVGIARERAVGSGLCEHFARTLEGMMTMMTTTR
jgi:hypothetical protein